jgi:hypothetical protein
MDTKCYICYEKFTNNDCECNKCQEFNNKDIHLTLGLKLKLTKRLILVLNQVIL